MPAPVLPGNLIEREVYAAPASRSPFLLLGQPTRFWGRVCHPPVLPLATKHKLLFLGGQTFVIYFEWERERQGRGIEEQNARLHYARVFVWESEMWFAEFHSLNFCPPECVCSRFEGLFADLAVIEKVYIRTISSG